MVERVAFLFAMILHSKYTRTTIIELQFLFRILSCAVTFDYEDEAEGWRVFDTRDHTLFRRPTECCVFAALVLESFQDLLLSFPVASVCVCES